MALGVLLVNDHVLKGAGIVPGFVTGKLSDFAGMLVAPALLAAVLQVRSRRGLVLAHLAVGIVFASIQLFSGCAEVWSTAMASIGFPWSITSDPGDLVALPFLGLSWMLLLPAMEGESKTAFMRAGQCAAGGAGLLACVATSPPNPEPLGPGFYEPIWATMYVHNQSDEEIFVTIRELKDSIVLDCFDIEQNPGGLLADNAFGPAVNWIMPPRTNVPVSDGESGANGCHAAIIDGDRLEPTLVFWANDEIPSPRTVNGQFFEGESMTQGGVAIQLDGNGMHTGYASAGYHHAITAPPEVGENCEPGPEGDRVDWALDDGALSSHNMIEGIELGVDGCLALDMRPGGGAQPSKRSYLCMPQDLFPFEAGDVVSTTVGGSVLEMEYYIADGQQTRLLLSRDGVPTQNPGVMGREAHGCGYSVDEGCAKVGRPATAVVEFAQAVFDLEVGQRIETELDDNSSAQVELVYAEDRALIDNECDLFADVGITVDYVAVIRASL